MSTQAETKVNTPNEVIEVQGNKLIETVKSIVAKDNVSRLIIYWANGDKLLDIPYAAGLTVTALVTLFLAPVTALTPFVLLLGRFKIEIVRPEGSEAPTSQEAPSEPEAEAEPTSEETEASSAKAEVEVEIEPATPAEEPEPDDLKKITGIGKVFEGRLHEAGIYTFAQLAETPAEKIKEIVSPEKTEQMFDVGTWIDQARELSQVAF